MLTKEPWAWPRTRQERHDYVASLRISKKEIRTNRSALAKVTHVCHLKTSLDVQKVKVCGSVGKRTDSIKASDLDLVVFVNGFAPEDLEDSVEVILDEIQDAMDDQYPGTRDPTWFRKFGLRYYIDGLEIDILVGLPGVKPRDFLDVEDAEQRRFMSASVSYFSTSFIIRRSMLFKDLVRVAKDWRDSFEWAAGSKPKSYLLEMIMLHAYRNVKRVHYLPDDSMYACQSRSWSITSSKVLDAFFEWISNVERYSSKQKYNKSKLPQQFICFQPYYDKDDLPMDALEPIFQTRGFKGKARKATAIVMDPANPTNNLWLTLTDSGRQLVDRATQTLKEMRISRGLIAN